MIVFVCLSVNVQYDVQFNIYKKKQEIPLINAEGCKSHTVFNISLKVMFFDYFSFYSLRVNVQKELVQL